MIDVLLNSSKICIKLTFSPEYGDLLLSLIIHNYL